LRTIKNLICLFLSAFAIGCGSAKKMAKTQKVVLLDNYFNNETKKDENGIMKSFHYLWEDEENSGFSSLGREINSLGAKTETLKYAPTKENLANADVYIIVDPDTEKETKTPHFMDSKSIKNLVSWVKNGGVMLLMANDSSNCELVHFNDLAREFGIQFKMEIKNQVIAKQYHMGMIKIAVNNEVFPSGPVTYLKDISTLSLTAPAKSVVSHKGDVIMAYAKLGKGTVFAVGDPWLYNEYVNGKILPANFQNLEAGKELMHWLLEQTPRN
jgi:unsaturated rhamnogalacturonyl hydrolase